MGAGIAPLRAADGSSATSATTFKLLRGARPAGLAGAYTALGDDIQALYYNPAALVELREVQLSASHLEWLDGVRDDAAMLGIPIYGTGAWAFGAHHTYATDLARDNWGAPLGEFNIFDFSAQAAFALQLGADGGAGLMYKILRQGAAGKLNMGSGFDFGARYAGFFGGKLSLGLASQNMGTYMALGGYGVPMPWTLRGGLGWNAAKGLNLALDYEHQPLDYFNKWRLGAEYSLDYGAGKAHFRGGWIFGPESQAGNLAGLHAGLGLDFGAWLLDYAFAPAGDLGLGHRASLTIKFGHH